MKLIKLFFLNLLLLFLFLREILWNLRWRFLCWIYVLVIELNFLIVNFQFDFYKLWHSLMKFISDFLLSFSHYVFLWFIRYWRLRLKFWKCWDTHFFICMQSRLHFFFEAGVFVTFVVFVHWIVVSILIQVGVTVMIEFIAIIKKVLGFLKSRHFFRWFFWGERIRKSFKNWILLFYFVSLIFIHLFQLLCLIAKKLLRESLRVLFMALE